MSAGSVQLRLGGMVWEPSLSAEQAEFAIASFTLRELLSAGLFLRSHRMALHLLCNAVAGEGKLRISAEHILPNISNLLIVQGTIQFSVGIIFEAALSYVGLGAQPPLPSWVRMLADSQTLIGLAPHMALFPGLAIVAMVLGLNLMGDGLRDWLDPQLRRER